MMKAFSLYLIMVVMAGAAFAAEHPQGRARLSMLPAGDIKPKGWIWKQMDLDLREGLTGNYPKVSSIVSAEIFVHKNGTLAKDYAYPNGSVGRSWWVGEVEGNWLDSIVRLAFLTDNAETKERVKQAYEHIIKAQESEPDGLSVP
jgi:uncharacterized protein